MRVHASPSITNDAALMRRAMAEKRSAQSWPSRAKQRTRAPSRRHQTRTEVNVAGQAIQLCDDDGSVGLARQFKRGGELRALLQGVGTFGCRSGTAFGFAGRQRQSHAIWASAEYALPGVRAIECTHLIADFRKS
jgi:hypothetical protein